MGLASSFVAVAQATAITTLDGSQGWFPTDVTAGGSASIVASSLGDGDGFLQLTTSGASEKAKVGFFNFPGSLGTLGDLVNGGSLSFDLYRSGASTANNDLQVAVRFYVTNASGQSGSIVWENSYNGSALVVDTFDTRNGSAGNWWIRSGGHNFDQVANLHTLSGFAGGATATDGSDTAITLGSDTIINSLEVGAGSGWSNTFIGGIDNVNLSFGNGGATYNSNFQAVPEPASMAALGLGVAAIIRRRRNKKS